MTLAAPVFVQEAESTYSSTNVIATTASFAAATDDLLLAIGLCQNVQAGGTISNSGSALAWTREEGMSTGGNGGEVDAWSHILLGDVAGQTVTVTAGGGGFWQHGVATHTWQGTMGVGATTQAIEMSVPSVTLTTTQDHSAIVVGISDFFYHDGTARAWLSVGGVAPVELTYFRQVSAYAGYTAYYADVGTAGSKTVGLSAPSGQSGGIVAVEVLGADNLVVPEQTDTIETLLTR